LGSVEGCRNSRASRVVDSRRNCLQIWGGSDGELKTTDAALEVDYLIVFIRYAGVGLGQSLISFMRGQALEGEIRNPNYLEATPVCGPSTETQIGLEICKFSPVFGPRNRLRKVSYLRKLYPRVRNRDNQRPRNGFRPS
jgi:hypothetical protein